MGQIGRHSPDHAKTLADRGVLPKLLSIFINASGDQKDINIGADLKVKTKRALKCILEKTLLIEALEPLLQSSTPTSILKYVVGQFAKILPHNISVRRGFVVSGCLQRLQEVSKSLGSKVGEIDDNEDGETLVGTVMGEYVRIINECYPEEIVRYYSPGYSKTFLDKVFFKK